MQGNRRRIGPNNGVIEGSIWDRRMKADEGKNGVKVTNAEDGNNELKVYSSRFKRNQSSGVSEKRKPWKAEERSPIQIRKTKSELYTSPKGVEENEKSPIQLRKSRSDTTACRELALYKNKVNLSNVGEIKCASEKVVVHEDDGADGDEEDVGDEEEDEQELEEENIVMEIDDKSIDVKEIDIQKEEPKKVVNEEKAGDEEIQEKPIPISPKVSKKVYEIKEKPIPTSPKVTRKPSQVQPVIDVKPTKTPPTPIPVTIPKPKPIPTPTPTPTSDEYFARYPDTQSKLQNIVDLVMWRDISRSTLVFGLGTFVLLSSSFTKDLNFSLISVISYMALIYLAAIFAYKSILCRGAVDCGESNETCLVGEEEAIWFLEVILPYLNEFLLKLRSLFSGDPATTMKLAALLFVLARCGSSITMWKLAKLGFFGIFIVPKVCSSYSTQLNNYGKFWLRRLRDAWDTCSHKKAVAAAVFTLVWNLSTITARIWAAFMLVVAIRYYQQCMLRDQWEEEQVTMKEKKGS